MSLTSKERLLTALNLEEPDRVPFVPTFIGPWVNRYWKSRHEQMVDILRLGLDQFLNLGAPSRFHPDVKTKLSKRMEPGEKNPTLLKVYETPAGALRQVVLQTEDWPHGNDIPVFSDFVVAGGRSKEYLIKCSEDVEKFRYLLQEPSQEQIAEFHRRAEEVKALAKKYGLLVNGVGGYGGTYLLSICGVHNFSRWLIRKPLLIKELLSIVHEWDLMRVRLLLKEGVDMVTRDGWYETPLFWSVKRFKEMIEPLIREEIDLVHQAGAKFRYIMSIGLMQVAKILSEMDIDAIFGVDPVVERRSPQEVRSHLGPDICLWGGISEAVTVQQGTAEEIRETVIDTIRAFAPGGGYILSTIGSIFTREAWEKKVPILIETWRRFGRYPMK
ncbi:MAG: hypothetical protein AYL32_002160 [Candidatus Bathyarchaeota archaeon B26-2]|nr:MAG: hypothetical protein AYL32_002160 [Candidatus Bathyarchaeota archaeon B26-2]